MRVLLLTALLMLAFSIDASATSQTQLLMGKLNELDLKNPAEEARKNAAACQTKFLGLYGFAVYYPGISNADPDFSYVMKYGSLIFEGTSDAIENSLHAQLIKQAEEYSESYNKSLLTILRAREKSGMSACPTKPLPPEATACFATPSLNILCNSSEGSLRCDLRENLAKLPPRPKDCDLDWGNMFEMSLTGKANRICAGDVFGCLTVLDYGKTWNHGGFTCRSEASGVTCTNRSKHGWKLKKNAQRIF